MGEGVVGVISGEKHVFPGSVIKTSMKLVKGLYKRIMVKWLKGPALKIFCRD